MPVNLDQYRGTVGAFNSRFHCKNIYINISIRMLDVLPIANTFLSILLTFIMFALFVLSRSVPETLFFGISSFNDTKNTSILNTIIGYILSTKRFDVPLTSFWFVLKHLCIENVSFKFYNLIVNSFTKFLLCYIIGLGI